MQNKANFRKSKIDATAVRKTTYEKFCHFWQPKNKANSKPIQSQFQKCPKMTITSFITKDYENEHPWRPKKQTQTNPISAKPGSGQVADKFGQT